MKKRPTIIDVARAETREEVRRAMAALGYVYNRICEDHRL
jgi:hypothetical protein